MRRIPWLAVVGLLLVTAPIVADDLEARVILEKAIKAHGGADALTKAQQCKRIDNGAQDIVGREVPFVSEVTRSLPDRVRLKIELDKKITTTLVFDGNKGWHSEGESPAVPLPPARLKEMREEAYVWWLTTLVPLTKAEFTLTALPKGKIDKEATLGIKVTHKGHAETRMYFYERNGLLAKVERRTTEGGTLVDKEYLYSGFREFSGVTLPTREIVNVNGKKYTTVVISNYTFPAKFEAGTFAKP